MAARKDNVQINIAFITDESKEYAKLIKTNQGFINDLYKTAKAGGDVTKSINDMVAAGKAAGKIDLSKVAPAQLRESARQLQEIISLIPKSTPQYKAMEAQLKAINNELAVTKEGTRGVAGVAQTAWAAMSTGARGFLTALGPIALAMIGIQSLFDGVKALFNIGQDAEALQTKMGAVFGESTKIVEDFATANANAIGLSRREYKGLATDVGDLLTPMGFTQKTAAELSTELVNQAGILSRWTKGKVDTSTATEILNKSLLGERDALNQLGLDIKDATIQAELKRKGLEKLTGDERKQAEALITLEQITKQSANANAAYAKGTEDLQEKKARLRARISEIADRMGTAMIPAFNKVLEILIPVAEWVVEFGTRLSSAWQKAETFRAVISAVFGGVGQVVSSVAKVIANFAEGWVNLLSGDFSKAFDNFSAGLKDITFNMGNNVKAGMVDGWNSVKNPTANVNTDTAAGANEGRKLAGAFGNGFDAEFALIKAKSKRSAEDIAKEAKKGLDLNLKEVEASALRKETILEGERLAGTKNELEYGNDLVAIKREKLEQSLAVYRKYAKDQTVEALKLQNELAALAADTARPKLAAPAAIGSTGLPGSVQSTGDNTDSDLGLAKSKYELRLDALKNNLVNTVKAEQDYEMMRLKMQLDYLDEQLKILKASEKPQVDAIRQIEEAKAKAQQEFQDKGLENEKNLQNLKLAVLQNGLAETGAIFSEAASILSQDEASKKKHAETIKQLQKANIQLNLVSEVSGIFANAQKSPVAQLLGPVAGNIVAGIQAGIATARAAISMSKVDAQKFERGRLFSFARGTMGLFGGNYHTNGGTTGVFSDGTRVEVEKDEAWAVVNRKNAWMLRMLSGINAAGGHGDPYFERGGLSAPNTTPTFSLSPSGGTDQGNDGSGFAMLAAEFRSFKSEVQRWQRDFRVSLVYSDIQATGKTVNSIASEAAL